jgi:hypothetical protein
MPMPAGLPNSDFAVIEEHKIRHCLLASGHPAGRGKAAFFQRFGLSPAAWEKLRDARSARLLAINDTPFEKGVCLGPMAATRGVAGMVPRSWGDKATIGDGLRRIGS